MCALAFGLDDAFGSLLPVVMDPLSVVGLVL
jgi:hypothetical protein